MYHATLVAWAVDASCQNRHGSMTSVGASLTSMLYSPAGLKFATRRLNVALQSWKLENIEQFEHDWIGKGMPQIWSRPRKQITWMMEVGGWNLPGCAFKTPWLGPQKGSARTMERLALLKACVPGAFKVFTAVGHENGLDYDDVQTLQVPWCVWKPRAWMKPVRTCRLFPQFICACRKRRDVNSGFFLFFGGVWFVMCVPCFVWCLRFILLHCLINCRPFVWFYDFVFLIRYAFC